MPTIDILCSYADVRYLDLAEKPVCTLVSLRVYYCQTLLNFIIRAGADLRAVTLFIVIFTRLF